MLIGLFISGCTFLPPARSSGQQDSAEATIVLPEAEQTPPMVVAERKDPPQEIDYHSFDDDYSPEVTAKPQGLQRGFRIQVITTENSSLADEIIEKIQNKLELPVYKIFEPPYYKVRVGNCVTQAEADELMGQLSRAGYETFIVRDMVNPDENPR